MIKITRVEKPLKRGVMWSGTAVSGADRYEWFFVPRGRFAVRREETEMPGCFMYVDPTKPMRRAVQRAVRSVRTSDCLPALVETPRRARVNRSDTTIPIEAVRF